MKELDLIIVGAGPIGLACGIEAEKAKLNYLIIDRGCLVNSIYNYPVNMTFFSTSERLEIGGVPFVSYGPKATRREALEYYRRVKEAYNLRVNTFEEVKDVKKKNNMFHVSTSKDNYEAKNVIVSTGYYDNINYMNVPGEELNKVFHYFKEAHPYAGKSCAVIGGGNSAVDVSLELFRTGADITLIIREDDIKQSVKYWVRPDIENRLKEGTIKSFFNASVTKITENELFFEQGGEEKNIANDFVFAMTGYHPDFTFLEQLGIKIENHCPVYSRDTLETNIEGLYLAGVVCGGMETEKLFIENTIKHGKQIIENILKHRH
ncbi:MAG: YpdA family putative bacillithiol disulfide reductase [Bacteroidetes bacterium]|nr:YpdA family putative bacillithiol disulfide reductase [Bacteroidota bacterium]